MKFFIVCVYIFEDDFKNDYLGQIGSVRFVYYFYVCVYVCIVLLIDGRTWQ